MRIGNLMQRLEYNGESSSRFGMFITGAGTYNAPERDLETVEVPGRNGDLLFPRDRFKNIEITYNVLVPYKLRENLAGIREWLMSSDGYCRLEDEFHPQEYRLAYFAGPLDFEVSLQRFGEADLTFVAKPQRFLKAGDEVQTITGTGESLTTTIYNPTKFEAKPLLHIVGAGEVVIGDRYITTLSPETYVDCDLHECYLGASNLNGKTEIANYKWPVFSPGNNAVRIDGNITKLEITPRWFTL